MNSWPTLSPLMAAAVPQAHSPNIRVQVNVPADSVVASREAKRRNHGSVGVRVRGGALSAAEARAPTAGGGN